MSIKIGHASIDENGKIIGGLTGDQTGKEICTRLWYNKPWNVYLECTDITLAEKAASIMEQICTDNNYGYDQGQRLTGYKAIIKNGGKVSGAKGEFDCSSLVSACYKLAGLDISVSNTTSTMQKTFVNSGRFVTYTDNDHVSSDKYAKRGSIYLKEGHHVVIALEDGAGAKKTSTNPYIEPVKDIKMGCTGDDVRWGQWQLKKAGYDINIDGECGPITAGCIKDFQVAHGLKADGIIGPKTRAMLKVV